MEHISHKPWANITNFFEQVYGSIVAGLYSNQQILPLSQMSVSADCFYQPRVEADFIAETDEANLCT